MTITLLEGDCLEQLKNLPDGSVQMCVTSPPYFALRDYGTAVWEGGDLNCNHRPERKNPAGGSTLSGGKNHSGHNHEGYAGTTCPKCGAVRTDSQIGLEESPEAYVEKLVAVFREVRRVLRDDGVLWLNLGDSYNGSGKGGNPEGSPFTKQKTNQGSLLDRPTRINGLKPKDLIGIPWMVAFALRADGWYLRQDNIWSKPNPMPESVTDRCTKSHEYMFLLSKSQHYYYDNEAIKEDGSAETPKREARGVSAEHKNVNGAPGQTPHGMNKPRLHRDGRDTSETGIAPKRNKRSVWTITTKPYKDAHFATFPPDLIEPCILAGTSERGACPACGAPWERVISRQGITDHDGNTATGYETGTTANRLALLRQAARERGEEYENKTTTIGWQPTCDCNAGEPVPCVVLDPFNGSGTSGEVALRHRRAYIGIELNPKYLAMTRRRLAKVQPLMFGDVFATEGEVDEEAKQA